METCYRHVLRHETRAHHARVDAALSSADIGARYGFERFLGIHETCFRAMAKAAVVGSRAHRNLLEMSRRIRADMDSLGAENDDVAVSAPDRIDPLALDYMIEGSRLGTRVLQRQWAMSMDATVQNANAYLSMQSDPGSWRDVCSQLSSIPVASPRAATITRDTKSLFDLFYNVAAQWDVPKNLTKEVLQ